MLKTLLDNPLPQNRFNNIAGGGGGGGQEPLVVGGKGPMNCLSLFLMHKPTTVAHQFQNYLDCANIYTSCPDYRLQFVKLSQFFKLHGFSGNISQKKRTKNNISFEIIPEPTAGVSPGRVRARNNVRNVPDHGDRQSGPLADQIEIWPIRSICPHFLQKIRNIPVGIEYTFEQEV